MLKKLFLFILLLTTGINALAGCLQLGKIDAENVAKYQKEIAYKFKRGSLVKKAALGSAFVAIAYVTYRLSITDVPVPSVPKPPLTEEEKEELKHIVIEMCKKGEKNLQLMNEFIIQGKKFCDNNGYYLSDKTLGWGEWAKGWGNWFARTFALSFVGGVASLSLSPIMKYFKAFDAAVDKGVNRIFPDSSISWYLTTHANLPMVFNDLNRQAGKIDKQTAQNDNTEFESSWKILVNQVERILGYIAFRNESFGPLLKERGIQMSINLTALVNQRVDNIAVNTPQSYADWIGALRTDLDDELHAFLEIEQIDRA